MLAVIQLIWRRVRPGSFIGRARSRFSSLELAVVAAGILVLHAVAALAGAGEIVPAACEPAWNQPWQTTAYDAAAGVSQQRVFDVDFETNGTVWLATSDGLRRYDGYVWERFGTNAGLPSALTRPHTCRFSLPRLSGASRRSPKSDGWLVRIAS